MGCANYHGWIDFEDGIKWLVRIPRTAGNNVPGGLIDYLIESEYATLLFLQGTKVPAPRTFGYGLRSDPANLVGVGYIFLEYLSGQPYLYLDPTPDQKRRLYEQFADIQIEISKHPVSQIGSHALSPDKNFIIGPVASNRFVTLGKYGPFSTAAEYYESIVEQHLDLIADGQVHSDHTKDAFLYYTMIRTHIDRLSPPDNARDNIPHNTTYESKPHEFYLSHPDDKGDHILVDENFTITGIIDWQFARCVPASEALGPSYFTADLNMLYSAHTGISDDDKMFANILEAKGAKDLAFHMRAGETARRFQHGLGGSDVAADEVEALITAMCVVLGVAGSAEDVDIDTWRNDMMETCRHDPRWTKLCRRISQSEDTAL